MIYIAHRGNTKGPSDQENHPDHILNAIQNGFEVEIDVWYIKDKFVLGHDKPDYEVDEDFLMHGKFWHHAKNIEAIHKLNSLSPNYFINCFYHQTDDCVLTSGGWIWTYPGKSIISSQSIAVMPETVENWNISQAGGICSDYVFSMK